MKKFHLLQRMRNLNPIEWIKNLRPKEWFSKLKSRLTLRQMKQTVKKIFDRKSDDEQVASEETEAEVLKKGVIRKGVLTGAILILTVVMLFAMTAAWYSNVIQTTGLIFKVNQWGLDSNVNINSELTNAAPGEHGTIDVDVYNSSDGIIDVSFNVGKASLVNSAVDMRKRLYFYIEDTVTSNGETTEKTYLNSIEKHTYTILPKQTFSLGSKGEDVALVWEWVYDVLGYYFYGTVTSATSAQVTEYLRPIVYDFESATFENGRLATVDGKTSVQQFINDITKNDGYSGSGATAVTDKDGKTYYRISADQNGLGVWVYCCSLSEIEYENVVDTSLGNEQALLRRFETNLNVLAEQKKLTAVDVGTAEDFVAALTDDSHNMIVLTNDIQLDTKVTVTNSLEKIVDLGEFTVSTDLLDNLIVTQEGSALTMMNGTLKGSAEHAGALINTVGSNVAFSGVTITDVTDAIWIADQKSVAHDTRMNIIDCKIECRDSGVFIKGNGSVTEGYTYLTVENTEIVSTGYYGIVGNGSVLTAGNYGTNITVKNSRITAPFAAIYHPQSYSSMLIDGSYLSGATPLAVKGGTVTVNNTEIEGMQFSDEDKATYIDPVPTVQMSGFSSTGAALYVETGYDRPCEVILTGDCKLTSYYSKAILLFENTDPDYKITVYGGSYSSSVSEFVASGHSETKDGERYTVKAN